MNRHLTTLVILVFVGVGYSSKGALSNDTQDNLEMAMAGEAYAYIKYTLFAEHARKTGLEELAKLFERTAEVERFEHFVELNALRKIVGSNRANLENAIKGETYESEVLYPKYAKAARLLGETEVSERFEELAKDEAHHRAEFEKALAALPSPKP